MRAPVPTIEILGVEVACIESQAALDAIGALHDDPEPALVAYVNAHTLNLAYSDGPYRSLLQGSGMVLNDGIGVALAARMQGRRFPENLNGSDFNPRILELAAARGWPVYFLGARPGVAGEAARRLSARIPRLEIVGARHGYFGPAETDEIVDEIGRSEASVLMVAMGNPAQEGFIATHLERTRARIGVGVGAFFDFSAGAVPRAPAWMNRIGIEWIYRLTREPSRMWRRYLLGNPLFLARVARERVTSSRSP